jgi:hypothetical protein
MIIASRRFASPRREVRSVVPPSGRQGCGDGFAWVVTAIPNTKEAPLPITIASIARKLSKRELLTDEDRVVLSMRTKPKRRNPDVRERLNRVRTLRKEMLDR